MYTLLATVNSFIATTIATATEPVTAKDWQAVIDALTSQISVSTVVGVLAVVVTACIGLVFMWWGLRKGLAAIMKAFKGGKFGI